MPPPPPARCAPLPLPATGFIPYSGGIFGSFNDWQDKDASEDEALITKINDALSGTAPAAEEGSEPLAPPETPAPPAVSPPLFFISSLRAELIDVACARKGKAIKLEVEVEVEGKNKTKKKKK